MTFPTLYILPPSAPSTPCTHNFLWLWTWRGGLCKERTFSPFLSLLCPAPICYRKGWFYPAVYFHFIVFLHSVMAAIHTLHVHTKKLVGDSSTGVSFSHDCHGIMFLGCSILADLILVYDFTTLLLQIF